MIHKGGDSSAQTWHLRLGCCSALVPSRSLGGKWPPSEGAPIQMWDLHHYTDCPRGAWLSAEESGGDSFWLNHLISTCQKVQIPAWHFSLFLLPWKQPFPFQIWADLWCWQAPPSYHHHYLFAAAEERLIPLLLWDVWKRLRVKTLFCPGSTFSQLVCLPLPFFSALCVGCGVTTFDNTYETGRLGEATALSPAHASSCILAGETQVIFQTADATCFIKQLFSFKSCGELPLCGYELGTISLSCWCEPAAAALMPAEPAPSERASLAAVQCVAGGESCLTHAAWSDQISSSRRKPAWETAHTPHFLKTSRPTWTILLENIDEKNPSPMSPWSDYKWSLLHVCSTHDFPLPSQSSGAWAIIRDRLEFLWNRWADWWTEQVPHAKLPSITNLF